MALNFHLGTRLDSGLQHQLGDTLAVHLASADLLGRMQIVRHAHRKTGRVLPIAAGSRAVQFDDDQNRQQVPVGTVGFNFDLPDNRSARIIGELTPVTRAVFDGLTAQYRRDAFTLAGVSDVRLIEKIRDALEEAARKGETVTDWKRAVEKLTSEAGAEKLNAFTLDTAFQTAMQKAYSAGRLEQMREPHMLQALPFWQYWTVGDDRVRPEHAVIHKFIARAIDPVWMRIYPPSGFNCRCAVVPVTEQEALRIDSHASEGGTERLMARMGPLWDLVPMPGFNGLARAPKAA